MGRFLGGALLLALAATGAQAEKGCKLQKFAEMPVTMRGLMPLVSVGINGAETRFTLDSGAFYSLISPGSAKELGLKTHASGIELSMEGVGGAVETSVTSVKLSLAGASIPQAEFLVGGSEVGSTGLLGENILSIGDNEFDFAHGMVRLMRSIGCEKVDLAYWTKASNYSVLPLKPRDQAGVFIIGTVSINGKPITALFDTGAATSMLTKRAAARLGVHPGDAGTSELGEVSGLGRHRVQSWTATFDSVAIGDGEEVRKTKLRIGDFDMPNADMLIGADFFLSHHVYVARETRRMFVTYNGGAVFNLERGAETPAEAAERGSSEVEPTDADGFARRGAARIARRQDRAALADLDRAVALAPNEPRYLVERARAHAAMKDEALALADLDQAIKLRPADPEARVLRASTLMMRRQDDPAASADLEAATAAAPAASDLRLEIAQLYSAADRFDRAVANLDLWITAHPDDSRLAVALNDRCWDRALADHDLPVARRDCDRSLRLRPHEAQVLDSRGMVELRQGQFAEAIADYDKVLASRPVAWSYYGRGIAKLRLGRKDEGKADIAAALKIAPALGERAQRYGIAP